jgi:RNA polymerase sigma-70 factor (ECF subfamily)
MIVNICMGVMQAVSIRDPDRTGARLFEQDTVARARLGDRAAFEDLYKANRDRIYALCRRMCGNDVSLAEDLLQQAFIRAWDKLPGFRGDSLFATWMHRLTVNLVLSDRRIRVRRIQREKPIDEHVERTATGAVGTGVGLRQDLEKAIGALPERARTVLVLYDIEGYRHAEIAEITGMAVGSSKAQLHRARKLVREALSK